MLWLNRTPRRLAFALYETLVLPWDAWPLAAVVGIAGVTGMAASLVKAPRAAAVMLLAFVPYSIYHLLFHETVTVRYALPVLPLVAWFATRLPIGVKPAAVTAAALAGVSLAVSMPAALAYGREPHPAYRALSDARQRGASDRPAQLLAHFGLRRSIQQGGTDLPFVEPRWQYEWLGPADYWRNGGTAPVWFFADPKRTDLALVDPAARRDVSRYRWAVERRGELSGTRPMGVDWYRFGPPGWFAGEGWSLTPETGGMARASAAGLQHRPIDAWVRRRGEAATIVIGGRHLGDPGAAGAELRLLLDGQVVDRWPVLQGAGGFLRFVDLPAGTLAGGSAYATLSIDATPLAGAERPDVAVRQFDLQPASAVVYGFGEGWHEAEYEPATGLSWRWTSERAVIRLRGEPQPARLVLRGESPLKYFDTAPLVRVVSDGRTLRELRPDADFEVSIEIPADVWRDRTAAVAIETDRVYVPAEAEGTADARRLGLRLFDARIDTGLR
jgi:hypothetical protein